MPCTSSPQSRARRRRSSCSASSAWLSTGPLIVTVATTGAGGRGAGLFGVGAVLMVVLPSRTVFFVVMFMVLAPSLSGAPRTRTRYVPNIRNVIEELGGVEDARWNIDVAQHVPVVDGVVGVVQFHALAARKTHEGRHHIVPARKVEDVGRRGETTSVDLGDARHPARVLLEVDAVDAAGVLVEQADRLHADVDRLRGDDRLGEARGRGNLCRLAAGPAIGEALAR